MGATLLYNGLMIKKTLSIIDRTLSSRITPLAYVFALTGIVWGLAFTLFSETANVQSTVLYQQKALFGILSWGSIMLVGSIVLYIGMLAKHVRAVKYSSMLLTAAWASATVAYVMDGAAVLRAPLAIINVLCYGYFYLAVACDRLWDYTPDRSKVGIM